MSKDERFDLAVREKLQDAEVKVPSGVWKAVSSRLDDIDGVTAGSGDSSRIWIWLGSGLAVAALALALVLTGTLEKQQPQEQLAMVSEVPESPETEIVQYVETLPAVAEPVKGRKMLSVESRDAAPVCSDAVAVVPEETEVKSAPAEEPARPAGRAEKAESPKAVSIRDAGFVAPEIDKKKSAGFGSYVSGSVAGNGQAGGRQTSYTSGSASQASSNYIVETGSSVYGVPFSIGAGVRYHFNSKLSLAAGLDYSLLTRSFAGTYLPEGATTPVQGDAHHYVHYLGIPINVYYNFLETSLLSFYGFAGGEIEFCLASKYRFNAANADYYLSEKVTNPLFSLRMGVGIEFKVSKLVGIYLDPGAYYCFYSQQPKSLRTERPFNFNINAGVRFNF